jgi:hypothetical protein
LAIGYAILMWGFSKDPFALGPKLPNLFVPAALRSTDGARVVRYAPSDEDARGTADRADLSSNDAQIVSDEKEPLFPLPDQPASNEPTFDAPPGDAKASEPTTKDAANEATLPKTVVGSDQEQTTKPPVPPSSPTDADQDSAPVNSEASRTADPLANPFGDTTTTPPAAKTPADTGALPDEQITVGPSGERPVSVEELLAAVQAAKRSTEAAVTLAANADRAKRNAVNFDYYANLAKVSEMLAHLDRSANLQARETAIDAAIGTLLDAAPTAEQLAELGKLARYWFDNPHGDGIVLVGIVKETKPSGKLITSVVEPLGKPVKSAATPITVVSPSPLTDDPSRPVLVAGTIVKDPATSLRGYAGSAKRVVWSALAIDPTAPPSK